MIQPGGCGFFIIMYPIQCSCFHLGGVCPAKHLQMIVPNGASLKDVP